jgi:uncharacterized protein (TIGR03382 family)
MVITALLVALSLNAAPPTMSREDLIARARPGVGYSYWWGGGCFQQDGGGNHGSCVGNCPDCTHGGSYGADCSGFVFKVWQINGTEASSHCNHGPYTANAYSTTQSQWRHINHGDAKAADLLSSSTHVVIVQSGDPWGTPTVMEARGCSYGIQRNTRAFGSSYTASERNNLGAPAPPAFKGTYVAQSFPVASAPAIVIKEGETLDGWFDLRNDGGHAWSNNTKLAPTPRDQPSVFADDSWLAAHRVSTAGNVAVGAVGRFPIRLRGNSPGEHIQTFSLVEEGTTWFAQQGGPADDLLAVRVVVVPRDHAAHVVADGFVVENDVAGDGAIVVEAGSTVAGFVDLQNDGHVTWDDSVVLAPTPRDQASTLAAPSWLSPSRVARADSDVVEGAVGRFTFEVAGRAEDVGTTTTQTFTLVHEGVTWFADAGFGATDELVTLRVKVIPKAVVDVGGDDEDAAVDDHDGDGDVDDEDRAAAGLPPRGERVIYASTSASGCAQAGAGSGLPILALGLLLLLRRRR